MSGVNRLLLALALLVTGGRGPFGSWACPTPTVFRLTDHQGVITTPNFPDKFPTPFCYHWIIDSGEAIGATRHDELNGKMIVVHMTQSFLKENFTTVEYVDYAFPTVYYAEDNAVRKGPAALEISRFQSAFSRPSSHIPTKNGINPVNGSVRIYTTLRRYFGIQVELYTPYATHFRTRKDFHNVFGFNITYEIVQAGNSLSDACSARNCSAAGNCYASKGFREFYCDCFPGRTGKYCQYSQRCDPKSNITFCHNGGTCRSQASGFGFCSCPEGFKGQLCEIKTEAPVIECPGKDCEETCDKIGLSESLHRPCSCHTGRIIPKGWIRYEGTLQSYDHTLPVWDPRSPTHSAINEAGLRLKTRIEEALTKRLREIPGFGDDKNRTSVAVVSFDEASKFSFQFFGPGPNRTLDLSTLKSKLTEGNGILFPKFRIQDSLDEFVSYPALALKMLTKRGPNANILKHGDDFTITCEAEGSRRVVFKWFKDGVPINPSLAIRKITVSHHRQDSLYRSTSILIFDYATSSDRGVFTCQVSDMGEEQCKNITVELVSPPIIEVEPMSLTLQKGDMDKVIICATENESRRDNFSYTWEKNGELIQAKHKNEIIEPLEPYGSLLRIITAVSSAKYSCIVANNAGESVAHVDVQVLDSRVSPACRAEYDKFHLKWDLTGPGQIAKRTCPPNYVGFVQRTCQPSRLHEKATRPKWGYSDFSRCLSNELKFINVTVQSLKMGFANRTELYDATRGLQAHLMTRAFLYTGEGEKIISLLKEIGSYALKKRDVVGDKFLETFFNTTTRLLKFPASCMYEPSVILLSNLIHQMATQFSNVSSPALYHSEVLVLERLQMGWSPSVIFPVKAMDWVGLRLEIPNQDNKRHEHEPASFLFMVFRNLTALISDKVPNLTDLGQPLQLISPLVSFTTDTFVPPHTVAFSLSFNISWDVVQRVQSRELNLTCAKLSNDEGRVISWQLSACSISEIVNNRSVECSCEHFGQYAILAYAVEKPPEVLDLSLHWSVVLGSVSCILGCSLAVLSILLHVHCQIRSSSLYTLKILVCSSLILSILFILSIHTDTVSVALSTCLCSLLLLSLSCHLTKALHVLLSTENGLFPWLHSVPLITLLMGFFLGAALPVWTAAAVLSHTQHRLPPSASTDPLAQVAVLSDGSPVFATFIATILVTVLGFLIVYYKATLRLRAIRVKMDSGKIHLLDYRMKTLNRALMITLTTLITILAALLHNNIPNVLAYQYFFGLASFTTGLVVFFSYTIKSEYPIPGWFTRNCCSAASRSEVPDPEKPELPNPDLRATLQSSRTPTKRFENGPVSAILLSSQPQNCRQGVTHIDRHRRRTLTSDTQTSQQSEPETITETLGGSCNLSSSTSTRRDSFFNRTGSMSSNERSGVDKRPSLGSSSFHKIPRSLTNASDFSNPPDLPRLHHPSSTNGSNGKIPHSCAGCCRKNSRTSSSRRQGSSSDYKSLQRGLCLLFEAQHSEYVMPSKGNDSAPIAPTSSFSAGTLSSIASTSSPSPATDLFPGYMNRTQDPPPPPQVTKTSPSYPDVKGRELTQFMTFHPKLETPGSFGRIDSKTQAEHRHRHISGSSGPPEAVYESIKGSRCTSLSNVAEDNEINGVVEADPEPPELPADTFGRGKPLMRSSSSSPLPVNGVLTGGSKLVNGLDGGSSGSLLSPVDPPKTKTESSVTMMIPLTELEPPGTYMTKGSSLSNGGSSSLDRRGQPKLDQSEHNVLGKIHRDLDYLLDRKDQNKLSSA